MRLIVWVFVVPGTRIELVRLAARDFESRASTYSAIPATRAELSLICYGRATVSPVSVGLLWDPPSFRRMISPYL